MSIVCFTVTNFNFVEFNRSKDFIQKKVLKLMEILTTHSSFFQDNKEIWPPERLVQ